MQSLGPRISRIHNWAIWLSWFGNRGYISPVDLPKLIAMGVIRHSSQTRLSIVEETIQVLHAVTVGKGILAICPLPGRDASYIEDLSLLREWRPSLMISLTNRAEMIDQDAEMLGADMQDAGCRWFHLPVPDLGIPDGAFEENWPEVQKSALAALHGGGRVLVHCLAGCGRSGMVALRLMVDAGEKPNAALERLRSARPCAVETKAQMTWALEGTQLPSAE